MGNDTKPENTSDSNKKVNDNSESSTSENATGQINNGSIFQMASNALPSFWHANPQLWFKQAEIIMSSSRITNDESKFNHIVKYLNESQSSLVSDIILNPPLQNKFQKLKETLIKRCEESEMRRIQTVLQAVEMGNHSPSSFHRQLIRMAGDSSALNAELIKKLWISRLPPMIGAVLIGKEDDDIADLYEHADRIWGMSNPFNNPFCASFDMRGSSTSKCVAPIVATQLNSQQSQNVGMSELIQSIDALRIRIEKFETNFQNRARNRNNKSRSSSRQRSNSRSNRDHPFCWYHYKFGKNAKKCNRDNCKFDSNRDSGNC